MASPAMRVLAKAGERLPDAQELPELVSEAMEADKAALFLLAPPYEAGRRDDAARPPAHAE